MIWHGELDLDVSIDLRFVRDFANSLGLLSKQSHQQLLFAMNEDTLGTVCRLHNISSPEAREEGSLLEDGPKEPQFHSESVATFYQQLFFVVELKNASGPGRETAHISDELVQTANSMRQQKPG